MPGAPVDQMAEARKKILCIEDDRETAKLIASELSDRGFYALIAYDARVGLAAILKKIPDLVICDVGLPEMSGFEILAAVNGTLSRFSRIPFIFLTGRTSREDELRGRSLGADDYLTKPIDFDILEEIIRARLIRGVVRHDVRPKLPKAPADLWRRRSSRKSAGEQVLELIDAPAVVPHPDRGTTGDAPDPKAAADQIIKP
jgi:DNA-binding response OmpR family regulator